MHSQNRICSYVGDVLYTKAENKGLSPSINDLGKILSLHFLRMRALITETI